MSFAQQTKHRLFEIISEMASHPGDFSNHPETDFSRNRKLDFHNLLQLIVSTEAGSVKDELLKFFSFAKDTASHSAFFQQRARLSDDALPYLFHSFNKLYPYTFYKDKYQLLAADGSSFTFTRNTLDIDSCFAPDGKTANGYNQVHIIPLFDLISKRYTGCVVQPVRKKNEFRALCTLIDRHQTVPGIVPVFIADRGVHSFNVFAHADEHHFHFMIRAADIKMQRIPGNDFPAQDCFDVQVNRILTRSNSKKKRHHQDRELKHVLGASNFHSKQRRFIEMELWARLLLYNFCSIVTGQVIISRKGRKHQLQVNYSVAYKACRYFLRLQSGESPPDIEGMIARNTIPIRPGRTYARQHRFRVPVSFTYRFA